MRSPWYTPGTDATSCTETFSKKTPRKALKMRSSGTQHFRRNEISWVRNSKSSFLAATRVESFGALKKSFGSLFIYEKYLHPDALRPHRPILRREICRGNHDAQTIREAKQKQFRVETAPQRALGEGRGDDESLAFVERDGLPIRNFWIEVSGEGNLC